MPTQLFISYRRKSWGFTHRLDEKLREKLDANIFIDYKGVADSDFERSILGELRRSHALLLVIPRRRSRIASTTTRTGCGGRSRKP